MTDKNFTDEEKVIVLLKISDDIHANANLKPEEAKVLLTLIEAKAAVRAEAIKELAERFRAWVSRELRETRALLDATNNLDERRVIAEKKFALEFARMKFDRIAKDLTEGGEGK